MKQREPAKEPELHQDLSQEAKHSGVYCIWLLFREKAAMPSLEETLVKLRGHFGEVDVVSGDNGVHMFALPAHPVTYEGGRQVPSQVMITECGPKKGDLADAVARTQFWDCPDGAAVLDSCPWQVMLCDFLAAGLPALERAEILADWVEIALSLLPDCTAVYFQPSGKLLPAEKLRNNPYKGARRFFYGGVNTRFFSVQGTDDMVVDTLGLYALGLPDVQYHFHTLDPNAVVNHAGNLAIYQFENNAPIESGHTVGGIDSGEQWTCQYERSLIQPARDVLDIAAGAHAAGERD